MAALDPAPLPADRWRTEDWGFWEPVTHWGAPPEQATAIVWALHGRHHGPARVLGQLAAILGGPVPSLAAFAPRAPGDVWYDARYTEPPTSIGAPLVSALDEAERGLARLQARFPSARISVFGFSQGACLALELAALRPPAAVVALAGARIGPPSGYSAPSLAGELQVLLGAAEADPWVAQTDIQATAAWFRSADAQVELHTPPGDAHLITSEQAALAREVLLGPPQGHA